MKAVHRSITLSVTAVIGLIAGIAMAPLIKYPTANAASQSGFVSTGHLTTPGGYSFDRLEDKDSGVICYLADNTVAPLLSCVKK